MTPENKWGDEDETEGYAELDGSGSSSTEERETQSPLPFRSEPSTPPPDEELLMQVGACAKCMCAWKKENFQMQRLDL